MKKTLLAIGLAFGLVFSSQAVVNTVSIATATATNLPTMLGGGANVIQFVLTSAANNAASITVYDAPTNYYTFTNQGYSTISSYVTNYIQAWTNYYGATNYWTNKSLLDVSNWIPSNVLNYATMYVLTSPTNVATTYTLNTRFNLGILVTNTTGSTVTLSYQYTQ